MSEHVWVAAPLDDGDLVYHFQTEALRKLTGLIKENPNAPEIKQQLEKERQLVSSYRSGEPVLQSELLSDEVILERVIKKVDPPPNFLTSDLAIASDDLRTLLEQFNLGKTGFKQVTLNNPFQKQTFPNYNWLNVCEKKSAAIVEKSEGLKGPLNSGAYKYRPNKDDQIVVDKSALEGVDLWMDERLSCEFFFSDRLYRAIKASKLMKNVRFVRCVVATHNIEVSVDIAPSIEVPEETPETSQATRKQHTSGGFLSRISNWISK